MVLQPAWAQKPPDDQAQKAEPAQPSLDPKACAGHRRATVGSNAAGTPVPQLPQPDKTISEKLAATDGVICPPAEIDPDIRVQPPAGSATPVIPPPGSPGGDPSVRPK
ncbi:MAG: hypothetical protein AB7K04_16720 [Pseudorhodoplanes sp.]